MLRPVLARRAIGTPSPLVIPRNGLFANIPSRFLSTTSGPPTPTPISAASHVSSPSATRTSAHVTFTSPSSARSAIAELATSSSPSASSIIDAIHAPRPRYTVDRTPSNKLPVYHLRKAGGNKKLTLVKKIEGDKKQLTANLAEHLGLEAGKIKINPVTGHVCVVGHHSEAITKFLKDQGF